MHAAALKRKFGKTQMQKRRRLNLGRSESGNVSVTFALAMLPLLLGLGMSLDYGAATKKRARMNAAADAAALSAVTPAMMSQTTLVAKQASIDFFNAQVSSIPGLSYDPNSLSISVSDSIIGNSRQRDVSVSYGAASQNSFGGVFHMPTISIGGSSSASSRVTPNIDFYLMLDSSPSMAIAATQAGIGLMVSKTPSQGGCAFACHETNPSADNLGNPGGPSQDNFALARSLGIPLRMDLVTSAVQNLMTTASATSKSTGAIYRMAGYTFDVAVKNPIPLTANLTLAQTQASAIQMLQVYSNNNLSLAVPNNDQDTDFNLAFKTLNGVMPDPGQGTNAANDKPQEVLFIVSDGVADQAWNGQRVYAPFGPDPSWCDTVKGRKIRIAVLYTTYFPLPTNAWYNSYVKPLQPTISPTAQACASPGLFTEVSTDGDISGAMQKLFNATVMTAHLTN